MSTTVAEVMSRDAVTVAPGDTVLHAARLMRDRDVGALPVCGGRRLAGMVTDRDIALRSAARGLAPADCKVADVMSGQAHWCFEDQGVGEALQLMGDLQVRRLPVIRRDSMELVGMVSLGDLATRQDGPVHSTLEEISRAAPQQPKTSGKRPDYP